MYEMAVIHLLIWMSKILWMKASFHKISLSFLTFAYLFLIKGCQEVSFLNSNFPFNCWIVQELYIFYNLINLFIQTLIIEYYKFKQSLFYVYAFNFSGRYEFNYFFRYKGVHLIIFTIFGISSRKVKTRLFYWFCLFTC